MKQISLSQAEHQNNKKVSHREGFLAQMHCTDECAGAMATMIDALSLSYFPNSAGKRVWLTHDGRLQGA
jgi:hypothetical protein